MGAARRAHDGLWAYLDGTPLSAAGRMLARALVEPIEAYYFYRLADYRRARQLLFHASALDDSLVTEVGLTPMSAHRLQLGLNLVRISNSIGERQEAIALAGAFLEYLEMERDCVPRTLASPRALLACVPPSLLELYFDQFCGEIALGTAGWNGPPAAEAFDGIVRHASAPGTCRPPFADRGHRWIAAKRLLLEGDASGFLTAAAEVLRADRLPGAPVWFGTVVEVIGTCTHLGHAESRFACWLADEAAQLSDAPTRVRALRGSMAPHG